MRAEGVAGDVADPASISAAAARVAERLGPVEPMTLPGVATPVPTVFAEAGVVTKRVTEAAERAGKDADAPPMLIIHGDRDTLAPIADARSFAAVLERTSSEPVIYLELPGTQHAFDSFRSPRTDSPSSCAA